MLTRCIDIKVDSFGECLKNAKFPADLDSMEHYWKNPGASMLHRSVILFLRIDYLFYATNGRICLAWKQKIRLLERYKFVLAFENSTKTPRLCFGLRLTIPL